jgi:hypothetical protein
MYLPNKTSHFSFDTNFLSTWVLIQIQGTELNADPDA